MHRNRLEITTDKQKIDIDYVCSFLRQSYWAKDIPAPLVLKSIEHSLCFSVLLDQKQIGFARVISDFATYAYLADVFIDEAHRGHGYAKQLMQEIMEFPQLQGLRRWSLMTRDAHGLYEQFGFSALARPQIAMEISAPDIYQKEVV